MFALECTGLGKRYGRSWALRDCTLQMPAGRVIGLVGPNGAGKTTLLHLAVGLLTPDEGRINILGYEPVKQPKHLLDKVGFVAQDHPLLKTLTVKETLLFGRKMNTRWDNDFALKRLARLGIPLNRQTGKLSGGQQAQVALLVALAKRPELLILDEPVASLDPLARREFQQTLIDTVAEEKLTILLSSHIVSDMERFCDYLIILAASQVQVAEDVERLRSTHKVLSGPRDLVGTLAQTHTILQASHDEGHSTVIVQDYDPALASSWNVQDASLEDIVLAYLARPQMDSSAWERPKEEVF